MMSRVFAICVLCMMSGSAFAAATPEDDLAYLTWRIDAKGVKVKARDEFGGHAPVYCVTYPEGAADKAVISFSAADGLRKVLDSWIPPFVAQHARRISFALMPVEETADMGLSLVFVESSAMKGRGGKRVRKISLSDLKRKQWNDLVFDVATDDVTYLSSLRFELSGGENANCRFVFADLRIALDDGRVYEVLNAEAPRYTAMMTAPVRSKASKPLPRRPTIKFGMSTSWLLSAHDDLPALGAFMKKHLPEYDFVMSMAWTPSLALARFMDDAPDNIFFQFQGGQHDLRYAGLKDALVKNGNGKSQSFCFNSTVATHPVIRDAFEDQAAYLGSLGFNSLQQYDYVWYYPKGYSGWDDATVEAFREDLTGRDEGLALTATPDEPERTIRFWEWFRDYRGETRQPSDLGFADWSGYRPKVGDEREESIYLGLIAYEWLRQAQRFGKWAKEHCHGGKFDFLLNSEFFVGNGNDHLYLARLKFVGDILPEFFDATPRELDMIYRSSAFFIRNARRYGKRWGVTLETSSGGGGSQPYWSPRTGYAVSYLLSALGYDTFEYDGAPCGGRLKDYIEGPQKWMLDLGMSEARAFRQAKIDGAKKPETDVFHLVARPVTRNTSQVFSPLEGGEKGDFRGELTVAQIAYETTVVQDLPLVLKRAKTIIVSPWLERPDIVARLRAWRDAAPTERTLVTTRDELDAALVKLRSSAVQDVSAGNTAFALPFECRVGRSAVVFNRAAVARTGEAEYETWRREILDKVIWRQIFDPAKCLYKDDYPDCPATANLRVPADGSYRVYRLLADREETVEAKGGVLPLPLGTALCDVFYFAPAETNGFDAFVRALRADRALTAEFLN